MDRHLCIPMMSMMFVRFFPLDVSPPKALRAVFPQSFFHHTGHSRYPDDVIFWARLLDMSQKLSHFGPRNKISFSNSINLSY